MYYVMVVFAKLFGAIPEPILAKAARWLGIVVFDGFRLRRSLMIRNIKIAFPELNTVQATAMARQAMISLTTTVFELMWLWTHDYEGRVEVINGDVLSNALKKGQGVYILCTHTGNFEVFAAIVSQRYAKVSTPVKRIGSSKGVNRFIAENRARQKMNAFIKTKKGEGFQIFKQTLAENGVVGVMVDQARPGEPRIPLFGKPAKTNTSLGAIWGKCPAPVIPGYCQRVGFARHVINLLPEIAFPVTGDEVKDILTRAKMCNDVVETIVQRCPEQFWWVHDRWK